MDRILESGLRSQAVEDLGSNPRNLGVGRETRQRRKGWDSCIAKPSDLRASDVGNPVEVISRLPLLLAPFTPLALGTRGARFGSGFRAWIVRTAAGECALKPSHSVADVVDVVARVEGLDRSIAQGDAQGRWDRTEVTGQEIGIKSELDGKLGFQPARELGIVDLVRP
jgi:hypothetical protein